MIGLLVGVMLACGAPPANQPPAPQDPPREEPALYAVPDLPDDAVLQLHVAESGYALRLYDDGRFTESWPRVPEAERAPFDRWAPLDGRQQQLDALREQWADAVRAAAEEPPPASRAGRPVPGGGVEQAHHITVTVRREGVQSAAFVGDLRVPATLGPVGPRWETLRVRVYGPRH